MATRTAEPPMMSSCAVYVTDSIPVSVGEFTRTVRGDLSDQLFVLASVGASDSRDMSCLLDETLPIAQPYQRQRFSRGGSFSRQPPSAASGVRPCTRIPLLAPRSWGTR